MKKRGYFLIGLALLFLIISLIFTIDKSFTGNVIYASISANQNLVLNPGFENNLSNWSNIGTGTKQIINISGNNVLFINNTDGSNIGILQIAQFSSATKNDFYFSYKVKPTRIDPSALVGLDIEIINSTGSKQVLFSPFSAATVPLGEWTKKEYVYYNSGDVKQINAFLINYYNLSEAYYDDVVVEELDGTENIYITNGSINFTINTFGVVRSLKYNNEETLKKVNLPLNSITLKNGSVIYPSTLSSLGNDLYNISYAYGLIETTLEIKPYENYIKFTIVNISDSENITSIELFKVTPLVAVQNAANANFAINATDNYTFLNSLPLSIDVTCSYTSISSYSCSVLDSLGLINRSGVLVVSEKKDYFSAIKKVVFDNHLPNSTLQDGKWTRESSALKYSYLFFSPTVSNYAGILNYSKEGKFRQILFIEPFVRGNYSYPNSFSNIQEFYTMADNFIQENISIGIHTFINQLSASSKLINFTNPDVPLNRNIYNLRIGNLSSSLDSTSSTIPLDNPLENNSEYQFLSKRYASFYSAISVQKIYFLIDNEIIYCLNFSGNSLTDCTRGTSSTTKASHNVNSTVGIIPQEYGTDFFFFYPNSTLLNRSRDTFTAMSNRLDVTLLDADGYQFPVISEFSSGINATFFNNFQHKFGMLPFFEDLNRIPLLQFGQGITSFDSYYSARSPSWDGVVFKAKEFTKNYKADLINSSNNPYYINNYEFGWWKINGANYSFGKKDFDATTYEDIDYVMTKVISTGTSLGLELSIYALANKRIDSLFTRIGEYHDLYYNDLENDIIPKAVKEYLKNPRKEATLSNISGFNFIEEEIDKQYAIINQSSNYSYNFTNNFGKQKLNLEIRPKFDYYNYSNPSNLILLNFSNPSNISNLVITSRVGTSCVINNDNSIQVANNASRIGGCKLTLPGGLFNLTNKRGLGISIEGTNQGELILVEIVERETSFTRSFKFIDNFTGQKEIILGNPTTDISDQVNGTSTNWDSSIHTLWRSWDYNWDSTGDIMLSINNIPSNSNYSIKINEIKALQEKSNGVLVNPSIKINNELMVFPINLSLGLNSPSILEYNGNSSEYRIYDENFNYLSNGSLNSSELNAGVNQIEISSNLDSNTYTTRAEIRITTKDDQDDDGVPTNGDYLASSYRCNGTNNFCDDNCPEVYNPTQADSDNNGVGDLCQTNSVVDNSNSGGGSGGSRVQTIKNSTNIQNITGDSNNEKPLTNNSQNISNSKEIEVTTTQENTPKKKITIFSIILDNLNIILWTFVAIIFGLILIMTYFILKNLLNSADRTSEKKLALENQIKQEIRKLIATGTEYLDLKFNGMAEDNYRRISALYATLSIKDQTIYQEIVDFYNKIISSR